MRVCPNCGKLNDDDVLFCTGCGMGLDEPLNKNRYNRVSQLLNGKTHKNDNRSVHKNNKKNIYTGKNTIYSINFIPLNEDIKFTANPKQNYSTDNTQLYIVTVILFILFIYFAVVMFLGFDILLLLGIVVSSIAIAYLVNEVWAYRLIVVISILLIYISLMMYLGINLITIVVVGMSALSLFVIACFITSYISLLDVPDVFAITNRAIYIINTKKVKAGTVTYPIENIDKIKVELQNVKEDSNRCDKIATFDVELRNGEILRPVDMHVVSNEDVEMLNRIMAIFKEYTSIKIEVRLLK
ncbi:MAG: zinc-ribbon domain-containing protein [Thermoplasmata archaeon]